jgi:hypothetical protein
MSPSTIPKAALARSIQNHLRDYLTAHLGYLREQMNIQTYRNLLDLLEGLVRMESGPHALWTSRIATELYGGDHEPAGVQRLDRVLANPHWKVYDLHCALHAQAEARLATMDEEVLIALDPSDLEKPESLHSEGLHKVVSPTARHLARPRHGFGGAP